MDENCDACGFLKKPKHQILVTEHWNVGLGNNQAYLGRAFVTLRTHKPSLGELSVEEWKDFEELVRRLEVAYISAFGAEPLNWGCYMNNAYRVNPAHPHVHWHIFPRYRTTPEIEGVLFEDKLFGEFYDNEAEYLVDDNFVSKIASILKSHIPS